MKTLTVSTAALVLAGAAAQAQDVQYAQFVFNHWNLDSPADVSATSVVGDFEFRVDRLLFGAYLNYIEVPGPNADGSFFEVTYDFTPAFSAGVLYFSDADLNEEELALGLRYKVGSFEAGGTVGEENWSVYGAYQTSPNGQVGLTYFEDSDTGSGATLLWADYSAARWGVTLYLADYDGFNLNVLEGTYDVTDRFYALAGIASSDFVDTWEIGAGWKVTDGANVELAFGNGDPGGGGDADFIRFGLEYEFGESQSVAPQFHRSRELLLETSGGFLNN